MAVTSFSPLSPAWAQAPPPTDWNGVQTRIETDGSVGPDGTSILPDLQGDYRIQEGLGERAGSNLFHSFSFFDLAAGDTALFTATQPTANVVSRVTGGSASNLDGTLASNIPGADFYFLNPSGVFFGPDAALDVRAAFYASTADELGFGDGGRFSSALSPGDPAPILSMATPNAFGFFGTAPIGRITVEESVLVGALGHRLGLVGGDIDIAGGPLGLVRAESGAIALASVASAGEVGFDPSNPWVALDGSALVTDSFESLGAVTLRDNAWLVTSGAPGGSISIHAGSIHVGEGSRVRSEALFGAGATAGAEVGIDLQAGGGVVIDGAALLRTTTEGGATAGSIRISARTVAVENRGRIVAQTSATGSAGSITVAANELRVDDASILSSSHMAAGDLLYGEDGPDVFFFDLEHLLDVGATELREGGVPLPPDATPEQILDAARQVYELSPEASVEEIVEVAFPGTVLLPGGAESIEALKAAVGAAGEISIDVVDLSLTNGGNVQSGTSDGSGGSITIDASGSMTLSGRSETGTFIDTNEILNPDGLLIFESFVQAGTDGVGDAGTVRIATPLLSLSDGAIITAESQAVGSAGDVELQVRRLTLEGASEIRSESLATGEDLLRFYAEDLSFRPEFEDLFGNPGAAGTVTVESDFIELSGDSRISVFAAAGPPVPAGLGPGDPSPSELVDGNITIKARDVLFLEGESRIEASVGSGLGGSIAIGTPEVPTTGIVLREGSAILAQARGEEIETQVTKASRGAESQSLEARGGDIELHARAVTVCPDCTINADGPTDSSGGSVAINNPESAIESQTLPPNVSYLDASAQLLARCGAQDGGAEMSRFAVARWPGLPLSSEGPLLAMSPLDPGLDRTLAGGLGVVASRSEEGRKEERAEQREEVLASSANVSAYASTSGPVSEEESPILLAMRGGYGEPAMPGFERTELATASLENPSAQSDALRGLAEGQQVEGAYAESLAPLEEALDLARSSGDSLREAAALGALGNAYVALAEFELAESLLTRAVAISRGKVVTGAGVVESMGDSAETEPIPVSHSGLTAALLNNLGNKRSIAGDAGGALGVYRESAREAEAVGETLRAAQAHANAARAALDLGEHDTTRDALQASRRSLAGASLSTSEDTTLRIHLAHTEAALARRDPAARRDSLLAAHADLQRAALAAEAAEDLRSASHALGNLGALYSQEGGREVEALYLTRRALKLAEGDRAADLMARWYAQSGRLHWRGGRVEEALDAYRRAVVLLGETRPEASAGYGSADLAFRQAVEPVYLALVDALLQSSGSLEPGAAQQARLGEAREVVEKWKAAELRNYFRDSCAAEFAASARTIEGVDPRAVVVYPIVLEDRLELLVTSARGTDRYTVPVSRLRLREEIGFFRLLVQKRTTREYLQPAQKLHEWLVAPYLADLAPGAIDTLVFVPGGALRTIPLAALHNGESFLIDRFAVAVTPSLNLIAPEPLEPAETELLLAGVSESVQGFPALAGVSDELQAIEDLYGGEVLLNEAFTQGPLESALREKRPGIVHLASHAEFTGKPETSFIMTHDSRLSMERLAEILRWGRYGEEPVELLMLSACETASGDERAALGLAGIAVRAGARSAMGSLWPVSDAATAGLVVDFYEALGERGISKAGALQRAQRQLRKEDRYQHPFYWAAFMVINNWL